MDLLTIGDCSIDMYMRIDESSVQDFAGKVCFYHGSKILVKNCQSFVAGNACNVAVGCNKLGLNTGVYTELGDDDNAQKFVTEFAKRGIDNTWCLKNKNSPTNVHAVIMYNADRTIFSYHEKRNYKVQEWQKPKWLYYTSIGEGFEVFQKELGRYLKLNTDVGVVFNPGTYQLKAGLETLKGILAVTDVLIVNKEEALGLAGINTNNNAEKVTIATDRLHMKLQTFGPKVTVITDGKNGSTGYDGKSFNELTAQPNDAPIVDKTGAGDAYASGFVSALHYGKPLQEAMLWGSLNAASVITEVGAVNGLLTKKQVEGYVKKIFRNKSELTSS